MTERIPTLLSVIEAETKHPQDRVQAQTCLAWLHWILAEPALAATCLPRDYSSTLQILPTESLTGWTEICLVKGACLKGIAQCQAGPPRDAIHTFQCLLPLISLSTARSNNSKELLQWSDQLLAQLAIVASKEEVLGSSQENLALTSFRQWAAHTQNHQEAVLGRGTGFVFLTRPQTWKAYYQYLSRLLQEGYEYPHDGNLAPRLQQYTELKRVESMHENNLLKIVRFPKAHDSSIEIETWVEQVIQNWKVFRGPSWTGEDFGTVGKDAVSRSVLDILYRAATKTFHSTIVLRRLFQVHTSLAEFDLAYKALDTYIEIVKRGKAKAAKAGEPASEIDDEDTILRTLSEGIEALCCFGSTKEAEKANGIASIVNEWIGFDENDVDGVDNGDTTQEATAHSAPSASAQAISVAHRAIGIALAQWARHTPFTENRSKLQKDAISHLKRSVELSSSKDSQYEVCYALGLVLAEVRDLAGAVQVVKAALTSSDLTTDAFEASGYVRQRKMIPLWHLMALILSGRHEFATADKACEAAFELFPSSEVLFGNAYRGQVNGDLDLQDEKRLLRGSSRSKGLVDDMERFELERIMEIRMTQIALIEVVEGPEVALNGTNELLGLFVRLFGRAGTDLEEKPTTASTLAPPKSSASTVKSFRGSIFGRKKAPRSSIRHSALPDRTSTINEKELERTSSAATTAPTIQVTDEDKSTVAPLRDGSLRHSRSFSKLHKHEGSINRAMRHRSEERASRAGSSQISSQSLETAPEEISRNASIRDSRRLHTSDGLTPQHDVQGAAQRTSMLPPSVPPTAGVTQTPSAKQDLPPVPHNYEKSDSVPRPSGHKDQPPQQDIRLPTEHPHTSSTQPLPQFSYLQAQKHAHGILVKVWLLIAGLYRRASMFEDAREACEEAQSHATRIEAIIATQESSARAFADPGWGGVKSSNELLADICAEKGLLAIARSAPHDAIDHLEHALSYFAHHGKATVALSNILLDIYTQKILAERPQPGIDTGITQSQIPPRTNVDKAEGLNGTMGTATASLTHNSSAKDSEGVAIVTSSTDEELRKTPANLNRLAARDRAYGLLTAYTKLGFGWDDSQAWFALARAHEESGQVDKAREVLWWCIELEDTRPIRSWRNLGSGGYVL